MEKQFTPNPEQQKPFEQEAVEAVERQEAALEGLTKTPIQKFASETIRLGSREVIEKSE